MNILPPMCESCKRLKDSPGYWYVCEAYPEGIPEEITFGEWDHRLPKPGDHGLQYVAREGAGPEPWWPDESGKDEKEEK